MWRSFHQGVVSQFDGYSDLTELDWDGYRARYDSIRRLDRLLEADGDTVNRYIDNHRPVGMISEADLARRLPEEQVGHFVEVVCATN